MSESKNTSASLRLDHDTKPAFDKVKRHLEEAMPGIRPNLSDVLRFSVLDTAKRIQASETGDLGQDAPARGEQ